MAGNAEPARVSDPVAVKNQQIRLQGQPGNGFAYRRSLAKRQHPRPVGKRGRLPGNRFGKRLQIRISQNYHRGLYDVVLVAAIYTGHAVKVLAGWVDRAAHDFLRQSLLNSLGGGRRQFPAVKKICVVRG